MVRVQSTAGVTPSISVQSGKSALRRDLRQQASRFALMSAIGLAAAAGGSLMAPGEALADCTLNLSSVVCNTTATTNTAHPAGQPNDRAYQVLEGTPFNATVTAGASVTGHGLAVSNLADGGVSVVNDGTITVDAGNVPTAGGTAALTINANGGVLSYTGGAITNNGTGNGLDARQNGGADTIDINVTGAVRGATGINARNGGGGGISIVAAAPVVGTAQSGIFAETGAGGGISIAAGDVTGQAASGITAQMLNAPASTNDITISADNVVGRTGVFASNSGLGGVSLTTTGNVTGSVGEGVFLTGGGDVDANIGGVVTGATSGLVAEGGGDISVQTTAVTALNGDGVNIDNQGAGEVDFTATGPITATNGHGVVVTDTVIGGDISVTTGAVTANTGPYDGINVNSSSATADISVVANGDIEAGNYGVTAVTAAGSTGNIDVTANGSISGAGGVFAVAAGIGSVNVTTVGPVTATDGAGIVAVAVAGGDVTVSAGDVSSANSVGVQAAAAGSGEIDVTTGRVSGAVGIDVVNTGDGATVVRTNGTVTGTSGLGILIEADNGIQLEVADTVTGATDGAFISAGNAGSGDISVTGAGGFVGLNGDGLDVRNGGTGEVDIDISGATSATNGHGVVVTDIGIGGDISVTTGAVTANSPGYDGIQVNSNSATANITVVANGDIQAGNFGVEASLNGVSSGDIDVTVNGSITGASGVVATTDGTGSVDVTTVGPVSATTGRGIAAWAFGGGDVTVDAGDVSSVGQDGVNVYALGGGNIDVTTGAVSGTGGLVVQNDGDGATVVRTNGAVVGTVDHGIYIEAQNSVELEVADTVTGGTNGAFISAGTAGTGDISVTGAGGFVGLNGDGLRVSNEGVGSVDIDISGATSATNGHGVTVDDTDIGGDISITTGAVTANSPGWDGINVESNSTAANISVVVNGDIQAGDYGVEASTSFGSTGDIAVTANGSITGAGGIRAEAVGTGSVDVTSVGPIIATTEYGIIAGASFGGDVTVTAGDVSSVEATGIDLYAQDGGDIDVTAGNVSGETGISSNNNGDGDTVIRTSGTVTGTEYEGIFVEAESSVRLEVADTVTGASEGAFISAGNGGSGDISVTGAGGFVGLDGTGLHIGNDGSGRVDVAISGAVSATNGDGIYVRSFHTDGGDINVTTGDVTALSTGYDAIDVATFSIDADISITANGDVAGDLAGIRANILDATASGDIDVTANGSVSGNTGILAVNAGSGSVTVNASGPVTADEVGVQAFTQGGDITVTAGDVSAAGDYGIRAEQQNAAGAGNIDVTTTGAVSGNTGIQAENAGSGSVTVNAGGPITATNTGVVAASQGGDITVAAGDVTAIFGIAATQENAAGAGDIDITTTGAISADYGILANNTGSGAITVNASGPITTGVNGIEAITQGGDITVTAGDVASEGLFGIRAEQQDAAGAGDIDITTTGTVSGFAGIYADNDGSGAVSVNAAGPVIGAVGIVAATQRGDVTVVAGDVSGQIYGIRAQVDDPAATGDIDVTTTGAISANGRGIWVNNAGSGAVRIAAGGAVTSADETGIEAHGDAIDVTVGGMVTGGDYGLFVNGGNGGAGDISVTGAGGFAATNEDAVFIFNGGTGTVTYDVSGPVSSTTGSGVVVADTGVGGDISVTTGSVTAMTAGRNAILVDSVSTTADVTIVANGALSAGGDAVRAVLRDGATGDVAVTTRAAVSGENGIVAVNLGTGSTTVTADGPITATGTGVFATATEGNVTVVAGDVTADGAVGIEARVEDGGTGDLSVTAGDVSGGRGIVARNNGSGAVTVVANGAITGTATDGIVASGEGAVTLTVADIVTGHLVGLNLTGGLGGDGDIVVSGAGGFTGQDGAAAIIYNGGSGTVTFDVSGPLLAANSSGLVITDTALGGDISVVTGDVTALVDGATAVQIRSASTAADINLTVDGDLQATGTGLFALLDDAAATGEVNVLTNGAVNARQGIVARNDGSGNVTVTSTGPITAVDGGITAASQGGSVSVAAADVSGDFAIVAWQQNAAGAGDVAVVTTGEITGETGILAQNDGSGAVSVNASGPITAGDLGITARSQGGDISIAAASVSGDATYGIHAFQRNAAGDGDIDITATGTVTGGIHGILASNAGSGDIRITSTGTVSTEADGFYGILAFATGASGDVVIDANNVSGADAGIRVDNNGVGATDLTVRGLVQGGRVGVSVFSDDDQDVRIANEGVIRNASGLASDRAIEASGGFIDFTNTGTITGDINFQADASVFDNQGIWNTVGGDSTFAGADDELINAATGSILAGSAAGVQEVTVFRQLETFHNEGRLTLTDNGAGDVLMTSANTVFGAGSLLQVDISGQSLADLFATTGTLNITAGARLDVNFIQPLTLGGRWVVARADGGLTGTFDFEDRLLTAFVGLRDGYTPTTAYIEIAQLRALMEAGATPNQRETGEGADSLPTANPLKTALLLLPNDGAAQEAFDQLSGEIHPAVRRAMADDSRQLRGAVLERSSDERGAGSIWGRVLVDERITDGDGNAAKVEHDARALIFGADRALTDNLTVGVAGGWFHTDLAIVERNSSARTESRQALAYLGARMDRWGLRAGVGYAGTSTDTRREIAFPGFSASPTADYDGSVLQGFVEAAYRLPLHGGYVEPFANVTAITAETDSFHEVDGPAALAVEEMSESLTATTLGFRFETDRTGALSLRGSAGWRNLSGDLEPTGRHAFDGGTTFTVLGAVQSDTAAVGALEAQWRLAPNVTLGAAWDGIFGNKGQDHAITGRLRIAF